MGYIYSALWFLIAALLIVRFRKEGAVIYVLSVYFIFLGFWWLVNEFLPADMLNGFYGWILRGVSLLALAAAFFVYRAGKSRKTADSPVKEAQISAETESQ